ncbi:MAG: hypothetical protein HOD13_08270 [Rhodospirillaceae bacterium]|jgi:hypothetical protein|nr:hypothetical protein [Rhodospirillaceae bacterium]MBT5912620.1 hypothetical protein [Rhodospirillaceae bacterium]MBT6304734.1 hypothetical protein [Rhodospirillaceae bacterium]MDC1442971.1 hypothetical protein [Rhodospirillaceae bacterium]
MEQIKARVFGVNKGIITLQKDLEFINGVAKNHKKWDFCAAKTVAGLIGWPSIDRVLKLGNKAIKENKSSARDWNLS